MKILFMTMVDIRTIKASGIYTDLLREFVKAGNDVYVISPTENAVNTSLIREPGCTILKPRIGSTQKTGNLIQKGISTIMIEPIFKRAIREHFSDIRFDLVLYSTPPITLAGPIQYVKKRDHAITYLMLKDIFPQNAVDLGMMTKKGAKSIIYRYFRRKEKIFYGLSDWIGCMSPANVRYLKEHNPQIDPGRIEICPNSIDIVDKTVSDDVRLQIRTKYGIPLQKRVIVFGGNLGKPQSIPFLISCLERCRDIENIYFLIVGYGTEYPLLHSYLEKSGQKNAGLMKFIPKEDYDILVGSCDIGLILLNHQFTIPNMPSRILGYMQAKLPILALTDPNTDVGKIIEEGGFGWWLESDQPDPVMELVKRISALRDEEIRQMGARGYQYMEAHYSVRDAAGTILEKRK